jgi:quinol monooxygenase YgiN
MIHVLAIITAQPGKRTELLELFHAVIPVVREERGCIEYGVAVDVAKADPAFGPDTYVVVEKWENMETLQAHAVAPHMKSFGEAAKYLIAKRAVHVLEPAPGP